MTFWRRSLKFEGIMNPFREIALRICGEVEQLNYLDLPQREMVLISIRLLQHDEMSQYHTGATVALFC